MWKMQASKNVKLQAQIGHNLPRPQPTPPFIMQQQQHSSSSNNGFPSALQRQNDSKAQLSTEAQPSPLKLGLSGDSRIAAGPQSEKDRNISKVRRKKLAGIRADNKSPNAIAEEVKSEKKKVRGSGKRFQKKFTPLSEPSASVGDAEEPSASGEVEC